MENMINIQMTPLQSILVAALNIWIFIVFPIIVIKKLNYLTSLLEAQYYSEDKAGGNDPNAT